MEAVADARTVIRGNCLNKKFSFIFMIGKKNVPIKK